MAEIAAQPDGSAQLTVSTAEAAGLKALASLHLPAVQRAANWFGADVAPELGETAKFLESLASAAAQDATLAASAPQVQVLRGMLGAHVPEFSQVLAVVESPAVRAMLNLARAFL